MDTEKCFSSLSVLVAENSMEKFLIRGLDVKNIMLCYGYEVKLAFCFTSSGTNRDYLIGPKPVSDNISCVNKHMNSYGQGL